MVEVIVPFATTIVAMIVYIIIIVILIILVIRATSGMEPIAVYTGERRVQGDPRSVVDNLKVPLEERGIPYDDAGDRIIVKAPLSYVEVYPITMPSPAVGLKVLVKPAGLIIAIILLLLGALGILIDVIGALIVYDRYSKVARIVEELRL
ncbi:MAG: hypothetical protein F7C08_01940 [Desulfurococcales archaeon]|nr:hypothetical protein [Desulfurococcales archaeon]MCE4605279.1 hypothetical protein [Desulfurococcales archaeon]